MNPILQTLCAEQPAFARLYHECAAHQAEIEQTLSRVVACGLLKAGKSSLLNALTQHLQREHFATHATRATVSLRACEFDGVSYIDTPGIDANAADDEQAWQALVMADQVLFAHNMQIGTLDAQELAFLQQLRQQHPVLAESLLVVLTHAESAEDESAARLASFRHGLKSVLSFAPPLLPISWPQYRKGMLEHKPALVAASGMHALQQQLHLQLAQSAAMRQAQRQARQDDYRQQMQGMIAQAIAERQTRLAALEAARSEGEQQVLADFASIVQALQASMAHYSRI